MNTMRQIPKGIELAPRRLTKVKYGKTWREWSGNRQHRPFTTNNWPMGLADHMRRQIHQVWDTLRSSRSNWMTRRYMSKIWSQPETIYRSCKWRRTQSISSLHKNEIIAKQLKHPICTTIRATPAKTKQTVQMQEQMSHQEWSGQSRRKLTASINMSSFKIRWGWHTRSHCLLGWLMLRTIPSNRVSLTFPRMHTSQVTICNHSVLQTEAGPKSISCLLLLGRTQTNLGAKSWMSLPQTYQISKRLNKSVSPISFRKMK